MVGLVARQPPATGTTQPAPARPRIALVNIAKVLKEFNKANQEGLAISKRRRIRSSIRCDRSTKIFADLSRQIQAAQSETIKAKLKEEMHAGESSN